MKLYIFLFVALYKFPRYLLHMLSFLAYVRGSNVTYSVLYETKSPGVVVVIVSV